MAAQRNRPVSLGPFGEKRVNPVGDAIPFLLIRRATFDLTGLPPTLDEIDAFLADRSATAFERLVDRLLSSPAFGERWGRHWLDVARYAESTGSARNLPFPHAWRYRDYVIDAFNDDKPYDDSSVSRSPATCCRQPRRLKIRAARWQPDSLRWA